MDNLAAGCKQNPHDALAELTVAEDDYVAAGAAEVAALSVAEDDYVAAEAPAAHDLAA